MAKILSSFFGLGYFPLAPGTLVSLVILFLYKFYLFRISWPLYLVILLALFGGGVISSSLHCTRLNHPDPPCIVVDEAVGQLLVLFKLTPSWWLLFMGFFLFRFFDIIKPYPIRRIESISKGWGIMLDDIQAAIYAGILVHIYLLLK